MSAVVGDPSAPADDDPCRCPWVDPRLWTTHYGAADPATTREWNPDCPVHGTGAEYVGKHRAPDAHCQAARDGDCSWKRCPQLRDGEPAASGRHCPLDVRDEEMHRG